MLRTLFFGKKKELSLFEEEQVQTPFRTIVNNFVRRKLAILGMAIFIFIFLCCMVLPIFFPLDTYYQDVTQQNIRPGFTFMKLPAELQSNAKKISGGGNFGIGIDRDGNLHQWGILSEKLKRVPREMGKLVDISAGLDHALGLDENGNLYTWGNDRFMLSPIPSDVEKANIVQIEAGHQVSVALDDEGRMHIWGNENIISISTRGVQGNVQKFVLNTTTALALLNDGTVVCMTSKDTPFARIPESVQGNAVDIASTDKSAAVLTNDGRVTVWGSTDYGVMDIPNEIQGRIKSVQAGRGHFTAILDNSSVVSWGWNNFKQSDAPKNTGFEFVESAYFQNYAIDQNGKVSTWGLKGYLLGTDQFGRDVFSRMLMGGRITMTVGAIAVIISAFIGIVIGGVSGYYGGKIDILLMRFAEIVDSIPQIPLMIILSFIVANKVGEMGRIIMVMVLLGILGWSGLARLVRGQVLAQRGNEFITAAKSMGVHEAAIVFKHIFPNIIAVVIVNLTLALAGSMLTESTLSFLGFGIIEPTPTWGNMLLSCMDANVIENMWWRWLFPGLALSFSTISINIIGDGLREAIDPKSSDR